MPVIHSSLKEIETTLMADNSGVGEGWQRNGGGQFSKEILGQPSHLTAMFEQSHEPYTSPKECGKNSSRRMGQEPLSGNLQPFITVLPRTERVLMRFT